MTVATMFIPIDVIRVSDKQKRKVDPTKVAKHVRALDNGDCMPIDVRRLDDGTFIIAGNGRHRFFAYVEAGFSSIPAREIIRSTVRHASEWLQQSLRKLKRLLSRK